MNYYNFLSTHADRADFKTDGAEVIQVEQQPFRLDLRGFTQLGYTVAILKDDFNFSFARIAEELGISEAKAKLEYAKGLE